MRRLDSNFDRSMTRMVIRASLIAALVGLIQANAFAVGLTYVDGDIGINGVTNLAPASAIDTVFDVPGEADGLWGYRSDGGVVDNPGAIFKTVFEASGGMVGEDAAEINQTLNGLTPNTSYDVYVAYWQGAQTGFNWNVRAGFSSGSLQLFNTTATATFPEAIQGTPGLHHDWAAAPLSADTHVPTFVEAGRRLLLGKIGATTSSGGGQITVFIDDLPTLAGGEGVGPSGSRSWFEGLAYVPAGTAVLFEPGDLNANQGIDSGDAHLFLTNLHSNVSSMTVLETFKLGDLNADLAINYADFTSFKTIYNEALGAGAFEAFLASVPEPSSVLLFAVGMLFFATVIVKSRRQRHQLEFAKVDSMSSGKQYVTGCIVLCLVASGVHAAPVTGWIAANSQNGNASNKLLTGADTNSPVIGDGLDNSPTTGAGQVALYADINGALDTAADIALNNGQKVILTGSVNLEGITNGNEQFRWGLFYEGGPTVDASGWLGYIASNSASAAGGALRAKLSPNTDVYAATGSAVNLQTAQDGGVFTPATYDFTMTVSRFDSEVSIDASLIRQGGGFSQVWKNAIPAVAEQTNFNFNRVGFLSGNNMSPDRLSFSNIDVVTAPADALTLQVTTSGPGAGTVQLKNNSGLSFDVDYYEISSIAGSLNLGGWNSLDDQESGDPETQGWDQAGGSTANLLSEVNLQSLTTMGQGASFNLGTAFNVGGIQDLKFYYGLPGGSLARGIVQYVTGVALAGDYNGNNVVDAADYVVWRNTLGQNVPSGSGADGDGNGIVQDADYGVWRANFGNTPGSGAGLGSSAVVPEPASASILGMAAMLLVVCMRKRTR